MQKRREFRVDPLKSDQMHYEALVDRHLQYFFASKLNRQTLVKTKIVNRKNEIIDRDICKVIETDNLHVHNSFRLKKQQPKNRYSSIKSKGHSLAKTVGKREFEEFLQNQRNQILLLRESNTGKNKTYQSVELRKQEQTI